MKKIKRESRLKDVFKGVGYAFILTVICLSIFSALLTYTDLNENLIPPVVIVVTGICILVGSLIVNKKRNKNGVLNGIIIGIVYISFIYIISSIVSDGKFYFNIGALFMMLVGIVGGAIGGLIGVNI